MVSIISLFKNCQSKLAPRILKQIHGIVKIILRKCQLRIKSEPFLLDLKFKSEHLKQDYLDLSKQYDTSEFC